MVSSWAAQYGNYLWANLILLLFIWGITLVRMAPLHRQLSVQVDEEIIQSLISVNWVRTVMWTVRSVLLLSFLS
jgi:hypothetical protein